MDSDSPMELENRIAMMSRFSTDFDTGRLGSPSGYPCPACNGWLALVGGVNFRCEVGHTWTAEALLSARDEEIAGALWVALRSMQEKLRLTRSLAEETELALLLLSDRLAGTDPHSGHAR